MSQRHHKYEAAKPKCLPHMPARKHSRRRKCTEPSLDSRAAGNLDPAHGEEHNTYRYPLLSGKVRCSISNIHIDDKILIININLNFL